MYMTYGDIDRPTLDNGVLFENFTDSMDTQALSCSEFESMTNLDADELTAFRGMVNELNKAEILSDSTDNWSFVRDEDGNEAAVYQKDGQSYTYAKTKKGETAFYDSYGGMPGHAGKTLEAYEQSFGRKPEDK